VALRNKQFIVSLSTRGLHLALNSFFLFLFFLFYYYLNLLLLLLFSKYRGDVWEKYPAFCERMISKHAGAQLLKSNIEPSEEIKFGTALYIQCVQVTPEPDRSLPIFTNPDVPPAVRTYYEHRSVVNRDYQIAPLMSPQTVLSTYLAARDRSRRTQSSTKSRTIAISGRRRHTSPPKSRFPPS